MSKNQLSIIIPVYNERPRIQSLITKLLASDTDELLEIILVNASRSNDSIEELRFPPKIRIIQSEATCRSKQLQIGAKSAAGNILYFLHADTVPPDHFMNKLFHSLKAYDFGMFNYRFDRNGWNFRFNGWMTQWKAFYTGGGDQGLFLKKAVFEKVGGFNTDLSIMEDYDIFWRLRKAKLTYEIVKGPAIVCARKYQRNSGFKVNLVNLITLIGFRLNGNADKWSRFYKRFIK